MASVWNDVCYTQPSITTMEPLQGLLDAGADKFAVPRAINGQRIGSIPEPGTTSGNLETKAGSVKLEVPKARF
jgi:hypothetical protein